MPDSNRIMTDVALSPTFPVGNPHRPFTIRLNNFFINKEKPVLKININDQQVGIKLQQIAIQLQHPRKLYGVLGETLKKTHKERFKQEVDPDGKKWRALSPVTLALKAKRGKSPKILRQEGYLSDKTAYNYDDQGLEFGSAAKYARLHQFGGQAGRGRKVTIPQRKWLGISKNDEPLLLAKATSLLQRQISKIVG